MNLVHLRSGRPFIVVALVTFIVVYASSASVADNLVETKPLAFLQKDAIVESSGLAIGRRKDNVFWTHNDSNGEPRLFAFDRSGKHLGTSRIRGAEAIDWEDMGSFVVNRHPYLFAADVGDNARKREHCTIYVAKEPVSPKRDVVGIPIQFRFADGPHDCEAVAYDPVDRYFLLVTKDFHLSSAVYRMKWPTPDKHQMLTAECIGKVPVPVVTGMDISPDAMRIVLVTYGNGYLIQREKSENWSDALLRKGRMISLPNRRQGESVCFGNDGNKIYLTSEKRPCPLFEVHIDPLATPDEVSITP